MWHCGVCSEQIEDDFDVCWNCKTSRDGRPLEDDEPEELPRELENIRTQLAGAPNEDVSRIVNIDFRKHRHEVVLLARAELERRNLPMRPLLKLCSGCKNELESDAEFCAECGKSVLEAAPASPEISCPECKKTIKANSKFCKYCATQITIQGSHSEPPPNLQPQVPSVKRETPATDDVVAAWNEYERNKRADDEFGHRFDDGFPQVSNPRSQREKANKLATFGVILASVSGIAFFWGMNFTSNWANRLSAGFGSMVSGQVDSTYQLAQACVVLGAVGVIVGIVLFIVGLSQR